ncbi:MAG: hypothetical protein JWM85_1095 [Acidimicrobiaceae bacterium]|nr:hypothetical protein [Acidimicrobiaceae bacterium]
MSALKTTARLEAARRVADTVLYEGYLLYPYRASSSKNQVRWQFGAVGPVGAAAAGVGDDPSLFTECLVHPSGDLRVDVIVRFLQVQWRAVEQATGRDQFEPVDELRVGATRWIPWHEAVAREVAFAGLPVGMDGPARVLDVEVPGGEDVELLQEGGTLAGRLVRTRWPLSGRLSLEATADDSTEAVVALRVTLENVEQWTEEPHVPGSTGRDLAARRSFVGAHLLMAAQGGRFISVVDPPRWAAGAARRCANSRCWPVLVGDEGSQSAELLLASPIIIPEHPVLAEESPGDLYDATEIDEILTLRIMTMTEEEKEAARGTDPRAAAIIDRSDSLTSEVLERLHGARRDPAALDSDWEIPTYGGGAAWFDEDADAKVVPETEQVVVAGTRLSKGSRVRLQPSRRADAHDMFLAGQSAVVARVDRDVDGETHVAVLLEDDPASELHEWYGRYYYFGPEELEPLPALGPQEEIR